MYNKVILPSDTLNLAKILPDYLKDEQLTFLALDTEWTGEIPGKDASFGELIMEKTAVKHFLIKKKNGRSEINPYDIKGDKPNGK